MVHHFEKGFLIMDTHFEYLASLPPKLLQNYLVEHVVSQTHRNRLRAEIKEYKEQRRVERLSKHQHNKLWGALIRDLKYERSNASVGRAYKSRRPTPERDAAFDAYIKVLDRLLTLLSDDYRQLGMTPSELAKEKGVPNNGSHWTDWVPETVKIKTNTLFDGIPYQAKAKRKIPFERKQRPDVKKTNKDGEKVSALEAMRQQVDEELQFKRRENLILEDDKIKNKIDDLERVQAWLETATTSTALPNTWHGVLRLIENGSD